MTQLCPGKEKIVKDAKDLEPSAFRNLVIRRARQLVDGPELELTDDEDKRRGAEGRIEKYYEKVHMGADFLPASFLSKGAKKARAVCRISTPGSYGTGFLISRGYLMTNNHVLGSMSIAGNSVAEFDYEDNRNIRRVAIEPERLFITNAELDFTIVACDDKALADIEPIKLRQNPAVVTRNDRVSIIQHPKARFKEVALHNNQVIRIMDKVLRYQTDTEPGSSGSPVFNNDWELVGLHHAGWREGGGNSATNEGIRISAIISYLLQESHKSPKNRETYKEVLGSVTDTSPYLGFFDIEGLEVEVPGYVGTDEFADVGVWNIEHFNNQTSDQRIEDVTEVIAGLSMDVMGLVEVQDDAMRRLVSALGQRGYSMGYDLYDTPYSQDLAVLYDRDTTTVNVRDDIARRHRDRLNAKTASGRTAFPRHPMFAECTVRRGNGDEINFLMILVHLKAFGDAQSRARRRLAADMLAEIVADVRENDNLAVVLGGDFNERLDNDVLADIKDSPDLFAMTADDATDGAISYVGNSHRSLIDHIVVSKDIILGDISGDDAAIVRLDKSIWDFADRISDHVPIVFRMVYRNEPVLIEPTLSSEIKISIPAEAKSVRVTFENS